MGDRYYLSHIGDYEVGSLYLKYLVSFRIIQMKGGGYKILIVEAI